MRAFRSPAASRSAQRHHACQQRAPRQLPVHLLRNCRHVRERIREAHRPHRNRTRRVEIRGVRPRISPFGNSCLAAKRRGKFRRHAGTVLIVGIRARIREHFAARINHGGARRRIVCFFPGDVAKGMKSAVGIHALRKLHDFPREIALNFRAQRAFPRPAYRNVVNDGGSGDDGEEKRNQFEKSARPHFGASNR